MSPSIKGSVRRNQLITTYGVGSIVALEDESFMVLGIDRWNVAEPNLHEPRLERQLGVQGFATPPAGGEESPDIPVIRFPQWHSCPSCRALNQHSFFASFERNECNTCGVPLVPSRFVIACPRGHIDDFPYFRWVHAGSPPVGDVHELSISSIGVSASLRDIVVDCVCGKSMSLEGAFGRNAMRDVTRCTGRRPWLSVPPDADCPETPRTLQRGASNVWYPIVRSALSIPPWSEGPFKALNRWWTILRHIPDDGALAKTIEGMGLARDTGYALEDLLATVAERRRRESGDVEDLSEDDLKRGEYEALLRGRPESNEPQDFACVEVSPPSHESLAWIERVMAVKRLREVRAIESFARIYPPAPGDPPDRQATLHGEVAPSWLPAMEVTGEGVFIELNEGVLDAWEKRPEVSSRAQMIDARYAERARLLGVSPDRVITPRLILLHSLAHALINQWALDCGYPAASLRERLYASADMRGILIYTATSDSSGSLGGIVGMARPDRLEPLIQEASSRAAWCSADPLCSESEASGVDSLNLAACHACLLLPEVSCEEMNRFLDRRLLTSPHAGDHLGFLGTED